MENKQELFNEFLAENFKIHMGKTGDFVKYSFIFANGGLIGCEIHNDPVLPDYSKDNQWR
jgi:hypothetical protein